jgi:hypothetical protein
MKVYDENGKYIGNLFRVPMGDGKLPEDENYVYVLIPSGDKPV